MSIPHQYHQPNAPDPSDDDSESDLELDLNELGPSPPGRPSARQPSSSSYDFSRRIPLRNIRQGRRRRHSEDVKDDGEDTLGLLEEGPDSKFDSDESGFGRGDDAPLLRGRSQGGQKDLRQPSGLARLAGLLSSNTAGPEGSDEPDQEHDPSSNRTILVGHRQPKKFPVNAVSNSRYTAYDFIPRTLYNEFKFFINLYFLFVALSQLIPALRIGYLYSYIMPLSVVLAITLGKEAWDDITRRRRDAEANSEPYTILKFDATDPSGKALRMRMKGKMKAATNGLAPQTNGAGLKHRLSQNQLPEGVYEVTRPAKDIKVGDIIKLTKNQRVPADLVILQSLSADSQSLDALVEEQDTSGEAFIRTDQLDGETDWKLRLASALTQRLPVNDFTNLKIIAGKPDRKVNDFVGTIELPPSDDPADPNDQIKSSPLSVDNTAWANTVVASSCTLYGAVIYTGSQTRQAMSTTQSRAKVGLLELEINNFTKILCILSLSISLILVVLGRIENGEERAWYISALRFLILFSTVIPISLRVNLDMGKIVYAWYIEHDKNIPETVVRTSTIPEDLGRIEYLLSDKTGTLTQNEMELKKVHVGTVSYANEAMDEVASYVKQAFVHSTGADGQTTQSLITPSSTFHVPAASATRTRREIGTRVRDLVLALALCHNVTPTTEEDEDGKVETSYQASSPDEIAIVRWTEAVGLKLIQRDRTNIVLQSSFNDQVVVRVKILNIFPFTSEGKRMGVVVKFGATDTPLTNEIDDNAELWFYQKGADTVMSNIVMASDWLDEETDNMAREGLRTLVVGRKKLSPAHYREFSQQYTQASMSLQGRDVALADVVKNYLEKDLELLGITGVEDKLQQDVKESLELLRNAGIKIWMLTGDKVETARCVATSSKLVYRGQYVHTISKVKRKDAALESLQAVANNPTAALLIDGESLAVMLIHHSQHFVTIAARLPVVIACRVSPIQKAELANLIKAYSGKRICCIGDGGNDVSMIQAADVGVGIVGKEGKQASLAADFSILQFRYLTKLLVWHGRNSYKRSAKLAQFVIHRGVIMSVCQVMFSIASRFEPNALYRDWLMIGYATLYTFAPVFSLVLDRDVDERLSTLYPELYKELTQGHSLSYRTFAIWLGISIYQGCIIQGLSELLIKDSLTTGFDCMVAVSYTSLILNELIMVAVEITTWHWIMAVVIVVTAATYIGSLPLLGGYMQLSFLIKPGFFWRVVVVLAVSVGPIYAAKVISRRVRPPTYRKVMHV
ncbi:phospholipid-translocating P-type ATPase [Microthyrium microscopicum]|uniref:Phospholipid-transporting ATPase n=1 Tax=Microthyrium microscopicum TaxID=703497 RepID=A0A6A6UM73_9PEZI|nr:phospholipid-translocating P-type ATPase [Microthyrium microscopicum]